MECVSWFSLHSVQVPTRFARSDTLVGSALSVHSICAEMRSIHLCFVPRTDAGNWKHCMHNKMKLMKLFNWMVMNCDFEMLKSDGVRYINKYDTFYCVDTKQNGLASKTNKKSLVGITVIQFTNRNHSNMCCGNICLFSVYFVVCFSFGAGFNPFFSE